MSSRQPARPSTFESSSDDDQDRRKPWELCAYCKRLAATAAEASAARASMPENRYSNEDLPVDANAIKYAKTLRQLTRIKNTKRTSISTLRGYPVTITDATDHDKNSIFIKWCIHDDENIASFDIYVDNEFHTRIDNPKRTSAVLEKVTANQQHCIQLRVKPIIDHFPDAKQASEDDAVLRKCTCNWGRILMRKSQQLSDDLEQWSPSTYYYSPNN